MSWYYPKGTLVTDTAELVISPEQAGWQYSGLHVANLSAGKDFSLELTGEEAVILSLSARDLTVTVNGEEFTLAGREGVFAQVSDWIYAPVGSKITLSGASGEVAICTSRATEVFPVVYTKASDVVVEVRGAGSASRQVTNYATPDSFQGAHKISVCEVITPGGNVSSWPPHRHDGIDGCVANNEEIYYFRIGKNDLPHGDPEGVGLFHMYTVSGSVDETLTIKDGDLYVVPEGYHGPTSATPEYPMYFLNVLAGPAETRTMAFCDDPDKHWIRENWKTQTQDPRLPWTSATPRKR